MYQVWETWWKNRLIRFESSWSIFLCFFIISTIQYEAYRPNYPHILLLQIPQSTQLSSSHQFLLYHPSKWLIIMIKIDKLFKLSNLHHSPFLLGRTLSQPNILILRTSILRRRHILTLLTLTILSTFQPSLITFTILLQTVRFLAIASLHMLIVFYLLAERVRIAIHES